MSVKLGKHFVNISNKMSVAFAFVCLIFAFFVGNVCK